MITGILLLDIVIIIFFIWVVSGAINNWLWGGNFFSSKPAKKNLSDLFNYFFSHKKK